MHTRAMATAKERRSCVSYSGAEERTSAPGALVGRSVIKPAASTVADGSDQRLVGILTMLCARFSIASDCGNAASLPASSHGSLPSRASNEITLRVMPFASVPTGANRNPLSPDRGKAKASELAILKSCNVVMSANFISCMPGADAMAAALPRTDKTMRDVAAIGCIVPPMLQCSTSSPVVRREPTNTPDSQVHHLPAAVNWP